MSDEQTSSTEPMPCDTGTPRQPVGERLKAMIDERTAIGVKKYGEPLHTHNGRSAERDALDESLDLNQYLAQRLMEVEDELAAERQKREEAEREASLLQIDQRETEVIFQQLNEVIGAEDLMEMQGYAEVVATYKAERDRLKAENATLRSLTTPATQDQDEAHEEVCSSCGNGDPENECPKSKRSCGHHCNHSWTHDVCCWCGMEFGDDASDQQAAREGA